jgi:transcriptional regulator GlxA family with amidase domain
MNTKLNHIQNWPERVREAKWSAATLAKQCNVCKRTLERYFFKHMGKSPKAWLTEQRQYQAQKAIQTGLSVKEVAFQLNYEHANQFSREFHKFWGYCPASPMPVQPYFRKQMS